ncbi:hypothetical protein N9W31_00715 [Litoricolaceae bacterium]|nr:hypothetical protein [Litorivicinaceae bacterium]
MKVRIHAVVVSHGHGEIILTTGLLKDLVDQGAEVICVDNVGDDLLLNDECGRLGVTFIRNPSPRGLASNVNSCVDLIVELENCRSLILLINPDVCVTERFADAIIATVSHCEPVICGFEVEDPRCKFVIKPLPSISRVINIFLERVFALPISSKNSLSHGEKYTVNGSILLCDLSLFRSLKGFDERFFLYCEDIDFVERACDLTGLCGPRIIWNSGAKHIGGYASRKLFSRAFWLHVESLLKYFLKRFSRLLSLTVKG